jgi:hypothetical protein
MQVVKWSLHRRSFKLVAAGAERQLPYPVYIDTRVWQTKAFIFDVVAIGYTFIDLDYAS